MIKRNRWKTAILLLAGSLLLLCRCHKKDSDNPILIIAGQQDFGLFTTEILKAEGFNEFVIESPESFSGRSAGISHFDIIILAARLESKKSKDRIRRYISNGGNIIAFEPQEDLSDLFGLGLYEGQGNGGYLSADTLLIHNDHLKGRLLQLHVPFLKYKPGAGTVLARFCDIDSINQTFPAIVTHKYGRGETAAILYNLPENVVLTRQGNPVFAGVEKDGIPGIRAMDLFTDGWIDTVNNTINQADEQMALLSLLIGNLSLSVRPLPRIWYFPDTLKCLVTLTNDGEFRGEKDFESQFRDIDSMGALMSLYVMEREKISRQWVQKWTDRGFEISGHPDDIKEASSPVWDNMDSVLTRTIDDISDLYGLKMSTVVNHWFVWCGKMQDGDPEFAAQAALEVSHGLSMDINYAHYDNNSSQGHFLGPLGLNQGNFTGSGLPMKFAMSTGNICDIYQHLNNVYDQQYNENHDPEGFFDCFKGLMDRSLYNGVYSFISVKSHNDEYYFSRDPLLKMLAYARDRGIPVWTAEKLTGFLRAREQARFEDISWSGNDLEFNTITPPGIYGMLTVMIPSHYDGMDIMDMKIDGNIVPYTTVTVSGVEYALGSAGQGKNCRFSAVYK